MIARILLGLLAMGGIAAAFVAPSFAHQPRDAGSDRARPPVVRVGEVTAVDAGHARRFSGQLRGAHRGQLAFTIGGRLSARPVEIGGRRIEAGERITLIWASANRDEEMFGNPDEFRLDRDPAANLLYGRGIHVCPGAELSRLELKVVVEELLASTGWIDPVPGRQPTLAIYPASGYSALHLILS